LTYSLFNQVAEAVGDPERPEDDPDFSDVTFAVGTDHEDQYGILSLEKLGMLLCMSPKCRI